MALLNSTFQVVVIIFVAAYLYTSVQALRDPVCFSKAFGLPFHIPNAENHGGSSQRKPIPAQTQSSQVAKSYISLMGIRQLAVSLIIAIFAYQQKWDEVATILFVLGFLVACTDGYYIFKAGYTGSAIYHALPGALIASLAGANLWTSTSA